MRIACLQFAPVLGDVDNNIDRANEVLRKADPRDLDLLILPELAFSGYNFESLQHIKPYLELSKSGATSDWACTTARTYKCVVIVGYPERVDMTPQWPANAEYYNSAVIANAEGRIIANYRKSHLYYTDETWALEGPDGFYNGEIEGLGTVAIGICMDLNPYKFESPWSDWEFAHHILYREANLVVVSMAWLTREDATYVSSAPLKPDEDSLSYWAARLEPLIRTEDGEEIVVVLANRCGTEGEAVYAGTSTVLGIQHGAVEIYGILGRGETGLLVIDTMQPSQAKLMSVSDHITSSASVQGSSATSNVLQGHAVVDSEA
ncbi:MAG: Carbon-nitrogen hydrolase [Claussenomyces sp. TS43310]|nr:MAG: Carbon-nitrogen hydrolase [Claussenomyces sp. TS43310]